MIFKILKQYAQFAIRIYCPKIIINQPEVLQENGPILLAANHPNSFLDGIILTTLFRQNIYSLARGDAFNKRCYARILKKLHLLPVYRTSEGVENLEMNYQTFEACHRVFADGGIVLIFSEGRCLNKWHLRPLKKGTARLAISTWQKGIDLKVIPVGFNYSSFRTFGKNLFLNFGNAINKDQVLTDETDGKLFLSFNNQLKRELKKLVFEIDPSDKKKQKKWLHIEQPLFKKILLFLPAVAGFIIFAPIFWPAKWITGKYFNNDHFDSALASILFLAFPFYLLAVFSILLINAGFAIALASLLLMPFLAWATVQMKVR